MSHGLRPGLTWPRTSGRGAVSPTFGCADASRPCTVGDRDPTLRLPGSAAPTRLDGPARAVRSDLAKDAEILVLRHQIAVLQRHVKALSGHLVHRRAVNVVWLIPAQQPRRARWCAGHSPPARPSPSDAADLLRVSPDEHRAKTRRPPPVARRRVGYRRWSAANSCQGDELRPRQSSSKHV